MITHERVQRLQTAIDEVLPALVTLRHTLHQQPEIALHETRTRARVLEALPAALTVWEPLLGTDLIAELRGGDGRTICLRADMDCVPVQEETGLPYASTVPGLMHACGHDGHTTMLVGAARVLASLQEVVPGTVRFIFQPGEEVACAGKTLVARGACDGAAAAYALHIRPGWPVGSIIGRAGVLFAAGSHFTIHITGRGGHGAMPEQACNPIPVAAALIAQCQALHARRQAAEGAVVTITHVEAGSNVNVIPATALLQGTARYLSTATGDAVEQEIRDLLTATAAQAGVTIDLEYNRDYDLPVINTEAGYAQARRLVAAYFSAGTWQEAERPTMGMEDFAYYLQGRDGAMCWLGAGEESPNIHAPTFDFPDAALRNGVLLLCLLALAG